MIRKIICINSLAIVALAAFFFIYPPVRAVLDIRGFSVEPPHNPV